MEDKILEILKGLIEVSTEEENKVKLVIKTGVRKCLNYMNRKDFPEELIEPLAEAIALENMSNEVSSVKMGDTQFTYVSSDKINISLKSQLNRFRKVGVVNVPKEDQSI